MSLRPPITLALEIQPGSEPLEGKLRTPDGSERRFTGMLGLLAAIESASGGQTPSGEPTPTALKEGGGT
jgi:hypothetical protein